MSKTLEHTLDKEMSEILAQITGNVHEQLQVTDGQGIVLSEQLQKRTPEAYSQGTMQQAYFSYRMAAGHMLMKEEPLPFLLDETFANYDEERLRAVECEAGLVAIGQSVQWGELRSGTKAELNRRWV